MRKNLALILISLDECFTREGFSGGGHKVSKKLLEGLVDSNKFIIDIYCKKSSVTSIDGVNSITVISNKKHFVNDLKSKLDEKNYDYILASDVMLPFGNLIEHSNSSLHKSKNGKSKLIQPFVKFYNRKKIKKKKTFINENYKAIFTF
jgi:hypothetical protein